MTWCVFASEIVINQNVKLENEKSGTIDLQWFKIEIGFNYEDIILQLKAQNILSPDCRWKKTELTCSCQKYRNDGLSGYSLYCIQHEGRPSSLYMYSFCSYGELGGVVLSS